MSDLPDLHVLHVHNDCRDSPGAFVDPEYVLTAVRGGDCSYRIGGNCYEVGPGDLILLRPHVPHLLVPHGQVDHLVIHFRLGPRSSWIEELPEVLRMQGQRWRQVRRWFNTVFVHWHSGDSTAPLAAALTVAILAELHAIADRGSPGTADTGGGWPIVAEAIRLMHDRFASGIDVGGLARELDISPEHLSRLFNRHSGHGPARFLLDMRIEHAQELLHRGGMSCQAIAETCGFGSLPAFSRSFKHRVGCSPTAWLADLRAQRRRLARLS